MEKLASVGGNPVLDKERKLVLQKDGKIGEMTIPV